MTPLTITQILAALFTALQAWSGDNNVGANVNIARDPFHVLELLANSPQTYGVIVHYNGDDSISDVDQLALVEYDLQVILQYNLGLTVNPDQSLLTGPVINSAQQPSLLDQLDSLRGFILAAQYPTIQTGTYLTYAGCKPMVTPEGIPLAAYILTFKLKAAPTVGSITNIG